MTALVAVETLLLVLLALLVAGLLRSHAEILRRLATLGAGDAEDAFEPQLARPRSDTPSASDLAGRTLGGDLRTVSVAGEGSTLIAFLSSGCSICHDFWRAFGDRRPLPGGARLVVVTKDEHEERPRQLARLAPAGVTVLLSSQAWDDYRVPVAPYFVHVAGGRVAGEGAAREWKQLRSLFGDAVGDAAPDARSTAERALRVEHDLRGAGIGPGHPSLYTLDTGPLTEEAAS